MLAAVLCADFDDTITGTTASAGLSGRELSREPTQRDRRIKTPPSASLNLRRSGAASCGCRGDRKLRSAAEDDLLWSRGAWPPSGRPFWRARLGMLLAAPRHHACPDVIVPIHPFGCCCACPQASCPPRDEIWSFVSAFSCNSVPLAVEDAHVPKIGMNKGIWYTRVALCCNPLEGTVAKEVWESTARMEMKHLGTLGRKWI